MKLERAKYEPLPTPEAVWVRNIQPVTRILVCGDRHWADCHGPVWEMLHCAALKHTAITVIHGGCKGVDRTAAQVALALGLRVEAYPVWDLEWWRYGRAAGPLRNQLMLARGKPQAVIGFHRNISASRGTRDMLQRALDVLGMIVVLHDGEAIHALSKPVGVRYGGLANRENARHITWLRWGKRDG